MLYQLVIYALGEGRGAKATILYPTLDEIAREAQIQIADPVYGKNQALVILRPVNWLALHDLISAPIGHTHKRARAAYARDLVFGSENA
jgi:hypothetical protein